MLLSERATRAHVAGTTPSRAMLRSRKTSRWRRTLHLAILRMIAPWVCRAGVDGVLHGSAGGGGWPGANHMTLRALEISPRPRTELVGDVLDTLREIADGHVLSQSIDGRVATPEEARAGVRLHGCCL